MIRRRIQYFLLAGPWLLSLPGCSNQPRTAVTQPAAAPSAEAPSGVPIKPEQSANRPAEPPPQPKPPKATWVLFREPMEEKSGTSITADWTGGKRLEVKTQNVRKIVLDLNKLPEGAPSHGPWTLQIDGQGIEIFGRKGRVMDLVRSTNGEWNIVPDSQRNHP